MKPYKVYRYFAMDCDCRVTGLLLADSRSKAISIVNDTGLKLIWVRRAWFHVFSHQDAINWFGDTHKLLKSGFDIESALWLMSDKGVSINIIRSLKIGQSFSEAICEQSAFFGVDSNFIARNLGSCIEIADLCLFLQEYNLFMLKNSQEISRKVVMPLLGAFVCLIILFVILYLLIYNLNVILEFAGKEPSLVIKLLVFVEKIGFWKFLFMFCLTGFAMMKFFVMRSQFIREYFLNKEGYFIFYLISKYLEYGLHLSECFEILSENIKGSELWSEIKILKNNLQRGYNLCSGFKACTYLSRYSQVVQIYECCGKINCELFTCLSSMEEVAFTDKLRFVSKILPSAIFGLTSFTVLSAAGFVLSSFRLDLIMS